MLQDISGREAVAVPLPSNTCQALPAAARAPILALQAQIVALQAEVAALHAQRREVHAQLGQDASHSSRPPSSAPPRAVAKRPRHAPPSGGNRGGQRGQPGRLRALLSGEPVDVVVVVGPDHCRPCPQPLPRTDAHRPGRPWRHQVGE